MKASASGVPGFFFLAYFIGAAPAEAADSFQLRITPDTIACGSFLDGRPVREVLALKARLGLKPGVSTLRSDGTSPAEIFDWIEFKSNGPRISPAGPGIWQAEFLDVSEARNRFTMSQEFRLQGGETL